ncbi:MAG: DUF4230 domain-containing protein [Acidobacteriota bacterium]|nr:DUF4230 domain-containing protein [Acidobacteriota bacterium]
MSARNWKIAALCLLAAFISLVAYMSVSVRLPPGFAPDAVVMQIQQLSQLVTVRCQIQRVVGLTEQKQPLGEESILLMVEGEVQAGVDLRRITAADVTSPRKGELMLAIPPAAILSAALDESKTKVWDRHITWWTPWVSYDPELEHKARVKALEDIRKAALEMGILKQASVNAQTSLRDLFGALGWKVEVRTRSLD